MRTNRPLPVTAKSSTPPVPVVVLRIVVQVLPSLDVWIWYDRPNAVSQRRTIRLIVRVLPRSTRIHCGSLNALDHRVPPLPSTARLGVNAAAERVE